jgi:hypothetical protein
VTCLVNNKSSILNYCSSNIHTADNLWHVVVACRQHAIVGGGSTDGVRSHGHQKRIAFRSFRRALYVFPESNFDQRCESDLDTFKNSSMNEL